MGDAAAAVNEKGCDKIIDTSGQPTEVLNATAAKMRSSVLSDHVDLPVVRKDSVWILFSLIQLMYLIFYIIFQVRLSFAEAVLNDWGRYAFTLLMVLVVAAAIGIPVRLSLFTAMAFRYEGLNEKFRKLFPFVLVLDEMWALTPFLCVQEIGLDWQSRPRPRFYICRFRNALCC